MPRAGEVSWNRRGLRPAALGLLLLAAASAAGAGQVELISPADPLPDSYGNSDGPALSADGRWIVFRSDAPNLVPGQVDANVFPDVFLHDRIAGATVLVSHAAGKPATASPVEGYSDYRDVGISADGRYVVFASLGIRLVPGQNDANKASDVFLYDRVTGTATLVSHASGDPTTTADGVSAGAAISADGNSVVFWSTAGNLVPGQTAPAGPARTNIFLYSRPTGALTLVSHAAGKPVTGANGFSEFLTISADGGYVAFQSMATDLVPGVTDTSFSPDIFLWQRSTGALSLVSHASGSPLTAGDDGSFSPQISSDGRWIAFISGSRNLVAGETVGPSSFGEDVYLFDRVTGQTRLVSHVSGSPRVSAGIETSNTGFAMSADGRWVAFTSSAPDLVAGQVNLTDDGNIFLYDRVADASILVSHKKGSQTTSPAPSFSRRPSISADGRYVAYESIAVDLVPHQTDTPDSSDVFVYDRVSRTSVLASHTRASLATAADGRSSFPLLSADGGTVVFNSSANDLGAGQVDAQRFQDVFLFERRSAEVTRVSEQDPGLPSTTPFGPSSPAGISADGRFVLFISQATGLVPGQVDQAWTPGNSGSGNGTWDVFLRDRVTGKTTLLSRSKASPPTARGGDSAVLSADGSFAAFRVPASVSSSSLMLYDRAADALRLVNHTVARTNESSGALSGRPALSAGGRFVAYACTTCSLVPGQRDGSGAFNPTDVFLYDRTADTHTLVSHVSGDLLTTGDALSGNPWISADGNAVAFISWARNLVPGQSSSDNSTHAFVFDRATGAVALIDHAAGAPATATGRRTTLAGMSADGRWIVFASDATDLVPGQIDTNQKLDLFLYDRLSGAVSLISHASSSPLTTGNGETDPSRSSSGSHLSTISADGRWIVFHSAASDLAAGVSDTNGELDVFLYDRLSGAVGLVSFAAGSPNVAASRWAQSPVISADGSRIAFQGYSPDLLAGQTEAALRFYVQDRATGARTLLGSWALAAYSLDTIVPLDLWISADGRQTAFTSDAPTLVAGDLNANWDAFVYDAAAGPVTVPPCTLFDGALRSNVRRTVAVAGACGVPAGAKQAILKLTVSQGTGKGNVRLYPGDVTSPPSGILRFSQGMTQSAGFTVPLGNGAVAVLPFVAGNGTVRVMVEVDGYVP
jgi:Tol biopolymer transport system component